MVFYHSDRKVTNTYIYTRTHVCKHPPVCVCVCVCVCVREREGGGERERERERETGSDVTQYEIGRNSSLSEYNPASALFKNTVC
jgi:hypothetical protein